MLERQTKNLTLMKDPRKSPSPSADKDVALCARLSATHRDGLKDKETCSDLLDTFFYLSCEEDTHVSWCLCVRRSKDNLQGSILSF